MTVKPPRKILYLDDITFHLLSLKERLKKHYDVYTAPSSEELFKILGNVRPDLILLDINMPEADGFDVLEKLKAEPRHADIPVMFLTSQNDKKSISRGLSLGAVDFLSKPFTDSNLIDSIEFLFDPEKRKTIKPAILAIDDDPSILQAVNAMLNDIYTVYTVPGVKGEKMITDLLMRVNPDLFLLDCNMPGLSGFDLASVIRDIPQHKDTPIMFLTAEGTVDNVSIAMHYGACDFMVKPIDKDVMRTKMALHLKDFMMLRRIRSV